MWKKPMKIAIEIRPGEGGDDAKLLVQDQAAIYLAYANKHDISSEVEGDS
jgi:protein subunit release factor A